MLSIAQPQENSCITEINQGEIGMRPILKAVDEELVTWKEVANYLRISVRHAQP